MLKNTFTIRADANGTITLSDTPVFNKMESGVTKLVFELPKQTGFAYLLCRHDRRDYYAIPILSNEILMGNTVTQFDGRWAFNVCITETELTSFPGRDDTEVYMSDTFEGLVYDNVASHSSPSSTEPNVLRLANDCRYWTEIVIAKAELVDQRMDEASQIAQDCARKADYTILELAKVNQTANEAKEDAQQALDTIDEAVSNRVNKFGDTMRGHLAFDEDKYLTFKKPGDVPMAMIHYNSDLDALDFASTDVDVTTGDLKNKGKKVATQDEIPDVSNFATKDEIPDVSNFATKDEIPDVSKFVNKYGDDLYGTFNINGAVKFKEGKYLDFEKTGDVPPAMVHYNTDIHAIDFYNTDVDVTTGDLKNKGKKVATVDDISNCVKVDAVVEGNLRFDDEKHLKFIKTREGVTPDVDIYYDKTKSSLNIAATDVDVTAGDLKNRGKKVLVEGDIPGGDLSGVVASLSINSNSHVLRYFNESGTQLGTVDIPDDRGTTNATQGAQGTKYYLVGAKNQNASTSNTNTYQKVYMLGNELYSNDKIVAHAEDIPDVSGFVSKSGGTMSGNLVVGTNPNTAVTISPSTIQIGTSSDEDDLPNLIKFGDGNAVYISEPNDDELFLHSNGDMYLNTNMSIYLQGEAYLNNKLFGAKNYSIASSRYDWSYVKYNNGMAIAWITVLYTNCAIQNAWGGVFTDGTPHYVTFPFNFAVEPAVTFMPKCYASGYNFWIATNGGDGPFKSQSVRYQFVRGTPGTGNYEVDVKVIGKYA